MHIPKTFPVVVRIVFMNVSVINSQTPEERMPPGILLKAAGEQQCGKNTLK